MAENKGFFSKVKAKAKKFWDEWGGWIIVGGLFAAGATVGCLAMRDCVNDEERRKIRAELKNEINYDSIYNKAYVRGQMDAVIKLEEQKKEEEEAETRLWTEEQRDSWDEICECVSKLDLLPDEEYMIVSGELDWDEGVKIGKNIICHTIEGEETYPPDCEAYIDADWSEDDEEEDDEEEEEEEEDDEEEEEEEENEDPVPLKITINENARYNAHRIAKDFVEAVENGDITVTDFS